MPSTGDDGVFFIFISSSVERGDGGLGQPEQARAMRGGINKFFTFSAYGRGSYMTEG
jgi:hypothetical protein